jgi:hypothetical protein
VGVRLVLIRARHSSIKAAPGQAGKISSPEGSGCR